jgi:hypothetical protein
LDALLGWTVSIFKKKNAEEVVSFALGAGRGLELPTAGAVGCILAPLRG